MILEKDVLRTLLHDAVYATLLASRKVKEIYDSRDFGVNLKSDSTPLTKADTIADNEIRDSLLHTFIPLLSEERRMVHYEERANWSLYWLVDPIDGTREFIKTNGEFTVNIALIEEGHPVIGVICLPAMQKLYFAARDFGSFRIAGDVLNSLQTKEDCTPEKLIAMAERLPLSKDPKRPYTVVSSRSHLAPEMSEYFEVLRAQHPDMLDPIPRGSSEKFCMVAEGSADLYPRITKTSEWDTAAGQAICELAGCEVVTKDTFEPLVYNKETMLNPPFIVRRVQQRTVQDT